MENYLHISFKNLLVYFAATLLSMLSLSHASNPFTSNEFDDTFKHNEFNKVYQFAYNSEQILQIQIVNDLTTPLSQFINLKSLNCDEQLWDIVNKTIIKNKSYNPNTVSGQVYDRNFALKQTTININLRFMPRDKILCDMQSVDDFDAEDQLNDNFFNYLTNEISGDIRIIAASDKMRAEAKLNSIEIEETKKTHDFLASIYL